MDTLHTDTEPTLDIAGFWRRLVALAIDLFLLGIAGAILGGLLYDPLARMGAFARLIGFAVALAYFGVCNSRLRDGQTVGKMLLGLRVVDRQGRRLSLPRSMLRYAVLGVPFFLNNLPIDPRWVMSSVFGALLVLAVLGAGSAVVYLYVFNRRTRQSLHDLAVGSYVVRTAPEEGVLQVRPVWQGHYVVVALLAALALSAPVVAQHFSKSGPFAGLVPLYGELSGQPHVIGAQVARGWSSNNGSETRYLQSTLRLDAPMVGDGDFARGVARRMAGVDPRGPGEDLFVVNLVYGYDMGIARGWTAHRYAFKPDELR